MIKQGETLLFKKKKKQAHKFILGQYLNANCDWMTKAGGSGGGLETKQSCGQELDPEVRHRGLDPYSWAGQMISLCLNFLSHKRG